MKIKEVKTPKELFKERYGNPKDKAAANK